MKGFAATAAAAAVALGLAACAHVEPPPGGPEDKAPPQLLTTRPDSLAVAQGWRAPVVLVFDERVSERGLEDAITVSPRTSAVRIDHGGDEVRVSLREGWLPGTIYHVTVLPAVQDLFGNRRLEPIQFVFSTGPEIPETRIAGRVTDRVTTEAEKEVRVEAIRRADSLVYATRTDTAGAYEIARVPEGEYLVRAFDDLNRNRALDPFEPRDSVVAQLTVETPVRAELAILMPDSTAPRVASVEVQDGIVLVRFDDALDPEQALDASSVEVRGPGGTPVPLGSVTVGEPAAARPETGDTVPAAPAAPAAPRRPSPALTVRLAAEARLTPGAEYTIMLRGIRNLAGLAGDAEARFEAPPDVGGSADPTPSPE